jgi:hypothetical protein
MTEKTRLRSGLGAAPEPHTATVRRARDAQLGARVASGVRDPATVSKSDRAKSAPAKAPSRAAHPATVPRSAAPESKQKANQDKSQFLAKLSADLPVVDGARLARNWAALVTAPPPDMRVEARSKRQAAASWDFVCQGVIGRVSYDSGAYGIAQVMLRPSPKQKSTSFWFMIDARRAGRIVNAEPRAYEMKETAKPFSALPTALQQPIRRLLEALYQGTYDV